MGAAIAAFVRHGDYHQLPGVPSAHQPFALTDEGREQARSGAEEFAAIVAERGWRVDPVIDCSRMLRAWQTAEAFADVVPGASLESFDELAERGLGCAANLTVDQIEEILRQDPRHDAPPPGWKADSRYRLPLQGAESLLDAGARVAAHVRRRLPEGEIVKLFVGHGAAFRHAAHHLSVLALDRVAALSMYHGRPVFLQPGGDRAWRHIAGEWKVRAAGTEARD